MSERSSPPDGTSQDPARHGPAATFIFADLAGYTALPEWHGDSAAADLATDFEAAIAEMLTTFSAQLIKAIGHDTRRGARILGRLHDVPPAQPGRGRRTRPRRSAE